MYVCIFVYTLIQVKCHQYWPDPVGSSADFGDLTVTLIDQQELAHLSLRTFDLVKVRK